MRKMVFRLEIELGNDAMQTGRDVAEALGRVVHRIEDNTLPFRPGDDEVSPIRDLNGNTVGQWWTEEE